MKQRHVALSKAIWSCLTAIEVAPDGVFGYLAMLSRSSDPRSWERELGFQLAVAPGRWRLQRQRDCHI